MKENKISLILHTGTHMPLLGLGTWKSLDGKAGHAVEYALLQGGYRHIDCAPRYGNEKEIGEVFKKIFENNAIQREDMFITSKLWNTNHRKNDVRKQCEQTLADLHLKYLDLYLIHWGVAIAPSDSVYNNPAKKTEQFDQNGVLVTDKVSIRETWEAMEELVSLGLVKAIGVANFTTPMIIDLLSYAKIKPAVNQIELHPYLQQTELIEFCQHNDIVVTAYSPLGSAASSREKGMPVILEDSTIVDLAKKHNKSPAQIILRWGIQRNTVVIPKSTTPETIKQNNEIFDFELSPEEMEQINALNRNLRFVNPLEWWKIPYFN